jgi:outer membrane protein OmpA-like peptidoglycan-associated protein
MLRFCFILIFIMLPLSAFADKTEEQLKSFLRSREVLEQVYFDYASETLTTFARKNLDSIVPDLKSLAVKGYLFRVEGFSSSDGDNSRNVNLSLSRALSVSNYLKGQHDLNLDVFLTGFGGSENSGEIEKSRRVDIAAYLKPDAVVALFDDLGTVEKISIK